MEIKSINERSHLARIEQNGLNNCFLLFATQVESTAYVAKRARGVIKFISSGRQQFKWSFKLALHVVRTLVLINWTVRRIHAQ